MSSSCESPNLTPSQKSLANVPTHLYSPLPLLPNIPNFLPQILHSANDNNWSVFTLGSKFHSFSPSFTPAQWLVHNHIQYPPPQNISGFSVFFLVTILTAQVVALALELAPRDTNGVSCIPVSSLSLSNSSCSLTVTFQNHCLKLCKCSH